MKNKYAKTRLACICIIVLAMLVSCSFTESSIQSTCYKSDRHMLENDYSELLWSASGINIAITGGNPMVAVSTDAVLALVESAPFSSNIIAYDTQTGDFLWSKDWHSPLLLVANGNLVYVGGYEKIEMLDAMSGEISGVIPLQGIGNITSFYHSDNTFYVAGSSGRSAVYDLTSGIMTHLSEPNFTSTILLKEGDVVYVREGNKIIAKDADHMNVVWEFVINEGFMDLIVTKNMIYVRTGYSTIDGILYAINKSDGSLAWNEDLRVISNVVATESRIYFLATDGYLVILDPATGEEIAKIEFSAPPFEMRYINQDLISGYFIDVNPESEIIAVSFGDSCQLMSIQGNRH